VLQVNQQEVAEANPINVDDLPGFVGGVFDHTISHPEHIRMLHWAPLEGVSPSLSDDDRSRLFPERLCRPRRRATDRRHRPEARLCGAGRAEAGAAG
jgi:hypothetical protein